MFTEVGLVPVHHKALRFVGLSEKGRVVTIVLYPEESNISFNFTLQVKSTFIEDKTKPNKSKKITSRIF